jgi:SAM-dependent methyltransferase
VKRLAPEQDAFGAALLDYLDGNQRAGIVVERDDGYVWTEIVGAYFNEPRRWDEVERRVLRYVRGRVLDVGVGAGRVALELQRRGRTVVAIDISPLVARVARRRGVKNVKVMALDAFDGKLGRFDTVVMFMNNFGLFGTPANARRLLRRFHGLTTERARIVATTSDGSRTKNPAHRAYRRRNADRGRLPGQDRYRLRSGARSTPWFDWLSVSPEELESIVRGTGWHVGRLVGKDGESFYALVLEKDTP